MNSASYLTLCVLGFVLGAAGQCARVIVGLKKTYDHAQANNLSYKDVFDANELLVSIVIGGVAGILAAMFSIENAEDALGKQQLFVIAGAGYAGADFIEGIFRNSATGDAPRQGSAPNLPAPAAPGANVPPGSGGFPAEGLSVPPPSQNGAGVQPGKAR